MTCQFEQIASILELEKVKTCLFVQEPSDNSDGFEDKSWNWSVEETVTSKENWLEECEISLSPTSELLVIAHEKNLVILKAKWDSDGESGDKIKYLLSWHGDLTLDPSEVVTSILCLPICAQGKLSAHCGADWTCIAVGFSSGAVRFYTEKGSLLHSEVFHEEPVLRLKCQTYQPMYSSVLGTQSDELFVIYPGVVCCIQGFVLCNTIKACRNQLARVQARCGDRIDAPPLALTKWSLSDQETINDVAILGSQATNSFCHLTTATIRGGYYALYRHTPPQISVAIASGVRPYVGFHCIIEGTANPVLTDVAKAVATKVKSAIGQVVPGWLGGGRRPSSVDKSKEKGTIEPAEPMSCRFGLCDAIRKGERIYMSPEKSLSVACDSLGRVVLIDNFSGIALKMWKGYRDAQCGFIPVEEKKPGRGRRALFLIIYAPKKGILEVWALQQGPKISVFNASKNGRLLYVNYGLLGVNAGSMMVSNTSHHPCVFINNTGVISKVIVPFHAILSKSDPRARDEHILKQIKRALSYCHGPDFLQLMSQLITPQAKIHALEAAAKTKFMNPEILESAIVGFLEKLKSIEEENIGAEEKKCLLVCENLQHLLKFYVMTVTLQAEPPRYSTVVPDSPVDDDEGLAKALRLTKAETQRFLNFITVDSEKNSRSKVKFDENDNKLSLFLTSFLPSVMKPPPLLISQNMTSSDLALIGELLCQCVLYGSCSIENWKKAAFESCIEASSLLHSAICYWLKKPLGNNARSEVVLFMHLMAAITLLSNQRETVEFWESVRSVITESNNITNALSAAIIARSVYLNIEDQLADDKDSDWETVSSESCVWSQLISQVEAVALLQSTLNYKPSQNLPKTRMPCLEYSKPDFSLSYIVNKGPGSVCESVAKWVSSWGLKPEWLSTPSDSSDAQNEETKIGSVITGFSPGRDPSVEARETVPEQDHALLLLNELRTHFPYSLAPGPLVAGQAWEYVSAWAKDPDQIELFIVSLRSMSHIASPHLKQGLCSIIWNVHLKSKFEAVVRLLHKVGKLPNEKLCRSDINMSDTNVEPFLKKLHEFIELFIESSFAAEVSNEMTKIKVEPLWTECQPSLAEICLAQAAPNPSILDLQATCVSVLRLLAGLPLRLNHPVTSLFDSFSEQTLWRDIKDGCTITLPSPDEKLQSNRLTFLMRALAAAIEPLANGGELMVTMAWTGLIFSLAREWGIPADTLRIHQVCQFYINNCDRNAEEVLPAVNDREKLGHHLLIIVGQRMKAILGSSTENYRERLSSLSPSLGSWVLEQEVLRTPSNIRDTVDLSRLVTTLIPESKNRFAILLYDAIEPLAR
ncbi:rab3 GTPase-activating protein non-catalytic subunit [Halyomorpha halys]|uniref:rab3 GTPase-activating protein non-catalytic subunit n=1 Tax=Halyomorpha halys TaxID=286706 RepID=UPI0006D51E06|nr:rab3 GTPase-activating protein non-catalytic subunit [Halyomorpha halys]